MTGHLPALLSSVFASMVLSVRIVQFSSKAFRAEQIAMSKKIAAALLAGGGFGQWLSRPIEQ
jgi:hypothetical protein